MLSGKLGNVESAMAENAHGIDVGKYFITASGQVRFVAKVHVSDGQIEITYRVHKGPNQGQEITITRDIFVTEVRREATSDEL